MRNPLFEKSQHKFLERCRMLNDGLYLIKVSDMKRYDVSGIVENAGSIASKFGR